MNKMYSKSLLSTIVLHGTSFGTLDLESSRPGPCDKSYKPQKTRERLNSVSEASSGRDFLYELKISEKGEILVRSSNKQDYHSL